MSERKIIISCESTIDMPYAEMQARSIPVLFYKYTVGDAEFEDDMCRTEGFMDGFYKSLEAGDLPHTSQINQYAYTEYLEKLLEEGDVIHLAFGSGMTKSVNNGIAAAAELNEKYPDRKVVVIDTLCSSCGYGLLVKIAADMRDEGRDMEEIVNRVTYLSTRVHHQFFSTDLSHYRRSGRMSGPAAAIGTILNICPIMRLDKGGHIIAYTKVRGKKAAIERTIEEMTAHAVNGAAYDGPCCLVNSACPELAEQTRERLQTAFPNVKEIPIYDIGTIIASHCGPGTCAVFFLGDERP